MFANKRNLDCPTNSPAQHYGKFIENSMENLYTDAGV